MKQIQIVKKFALQLPDRTMRVFHAGVHEVSEDVANHWYVKAHTAAPASEEAKPAAKGKAAGPTAPAAPAAPVVPVAPAAPAAPAATPAAPAAPEAK